jgi:hypothetical protein
MNVDVAPKFDLADVILQKLQVVMAGNGLRPKDSPAPSKSTSGESVQADDGPHPLAVLLTSAWLRMAFGIDQATAKPPAPPPPPAPMARASGA